MADEPVHPLGRLREFVKDWTQLERSGFTLSELRRYLDPDYAERLDTLRRTADAIEQGRVFDLLTPEELNQLRGKDTIRGETTEGAPTNRPDTSNLKGADERERRDRWLSEKERDLFKHLVYVGNGVTIADAERWLREALEQPGIGGRASAVSEDSADLLQRLRHDHDHLARVQELSRRFEGADAEALEFLLREYERMSAMLLDD